LGKGIPTDKQIEQFTVGNDRELDLVLAKYDALGPMQKCLAKLVY
jgi:argininosuccinate lyase